MLCFSPEDQKISAENVDKLKAFVISASVSVVIKKKTTTSISN